MKTLRISKKESINSWIKILILFTSIVLFAIMTSSCDSPSKQHRREVEFNTQHPEFKGVILSWMDVQLPAGMYRVYRIKDLERNVIINREFSLKSLHIVYYEYGDTLYLRR